MAVEMVLNDLSLLSPVGERGTARRLMTDLIGVLSTAVISGIKTLRTQDNLYNLMLTPDYPIASWLNDGQVEREERSFLQTLGTKSPLLAEITDPIVQEEESLADFKHQGETAYALGIAYLLNALAVSFHSDPRWDCDSLNLEITRLESGSEKLTTNTESLIHASQREHILVHKVQIQDRLRSESWHPQDLLLPCYIAANGGKPLVEWLNSLDVLAKEIVQSRLNQVKRGTLGDYKPVGEGVWELRIFYGPAYRIYFGYITTTHVLLLCGGNKSTQVEDIIKAKQHWQDYKQQKRILG
jgi:putative addiction module killer protein